MLDQGWGVGRKASRLLPGEVLGFYPPDQQPDVSARQAGVWRAGGDGGGGGGGSFRLS